MQGINLKLTQQWSMGGDTIGTVLTEQYPGFVVVAAAAVIIVTHKPHPGVCWPQEALVVDETLDTVPLTEDWVTRASFRFVQGKAHSVFKPHGHFLQCLYFSFVFGLCQK